MLATERECRVCEHVEVGYPASWTAFEACDCRCHLAPNGANRDTYNTYQRRYKMWVRAGKPGIFKEWNEHS